MRISAIVPVWNGRADLETLLASLAEQSQPVSELLVVDNGSTDGSPEVARKYGARVISMGRNAGFAPAVNRGIREASGEWIAVLNSDVKLAPDYLARLCSSDGWFASGKILSMANPSLVDGTFDLICRGGTTWRAGSGFADTRVFSTARPVFSIPWTAALFRSDLFERAGLLEERFESYLEDVDFGLRCAALGLPGWYMPEALAWHRGSATLGRWHSQTVRRISRNQVLLLARHYPRRLLLEAFWPILIAQLLWGALAVRHGKGVPWLHGKMQGLQIFSDCRKSGDRSGAELMQHLRQDEAMIRKLQRTAGPDLYWKLYFFLTGAESK